MSPNLIAILSTAIVVTVMIIIYLKQRNKKKLFYTIDSIIPLLNIKNGIGELEIAHRGRKVESPYLISLSFHNAGNVPIIKDDFATCITIYFSDEAIIIGNPEIYDSIPNDLKPSLMPMKNMIEVNPTLLNSGDRFSIKVLIDEHDPPCIRNIKVNGRITGVKKIEYKTGLTKARKFTKLPAKYVFPFIFLFFLVTIFIGEYLNLTVLATIMGIALLVFIALLVAYSNMYSD